MPLAPLFIQRSLRDTDMIMRAAMRAGKRVSGKIRARFMEEFRSGNRFFVRPYVIKQLGPLLVNTMLAGHLAGFRRFWLIRKQEPGLMRKLNDGELKLSALDDAIAILQRRTGLNLDDLQRKYNTRAIKVLNDTTAEIEKSLRDEFELLLREGAHAREAIERLGAKFDELGLSPRQPYQLETIFRTQLQMTFSAGRYQAEQDPDIAEILWGYKYVTVGDDRVRDEHAALEGVTLPKDDPFWNRFYPPNGWNCRCQAIPIFEQREIRKPPQTMPDGSPLEPDKDFNFNPGKVFV